MDWGEIQNNVKFSTSVDWQDGRGRQEIHEEKSSGARMLCFYVFKSENSFKSERICWFLNKWGKREQWYKGEKLLLLQ